MGSSPAWQTARRIDAHFHVTDADPDAGFSRSTRRLDREQTERSLRQAEKLGIDVLCTSFPLTSECPTPEEVHLANNVTLEAMAMSERFLGFCFLNPGYARESLGEIERCIVDGGMIGIKLYHQYRICDPALTPVMQRAAELHVPVLMHAGKGRDTETKIQQPRLSDASVRYPNLYLELSRARDGMCKLPAEIAAERMVFGTGAPFKCVTPALLKLDLAPELDEPARRRIGWGNGRRLLGLM
jgi:predicted TIM-barrel fold metal-dependent hydrolase